MLVDVGHFDKIKYFNQDSEFFLFIVLISPTAFHSTLIHCDPSSSLIMLDSLSKEVEC